VTAFAIGPYTLALMQGAALPEKERQQLVKRLSRYTGLDADFIERCELRVDINRFVKQLLRDKRRTVGRLDSRFTGIDRDAAGEHVEYDPSHTMIQGPFTALLNDYVRGQLAFESDLPYEVLADIWQEWRYEQHQNVYVDVAETLRKAMSMNPDLKVFVANGYYDLATPFLATEYTFNHLQLDDELMKNISMAYYEAGHMMYIHQPSLQQLKRDLKTFVNSAVV
jgi:carboxypeptidase C (cathepsin A)